MQSGEHEDDDEYMASEAALAPPISFGALAKAQANLQLRANHPDSVTSDKGGKEMSGNYDTWQDNEALERKAGQKDHRDFNRASKHAPTELSSKKAVSRRREVIPVTKRQFRDPRFETLSGPLDESKAQMAYSFLNDYREDEMKELRVAIKKAKDETEKERLKRALLSMESKKKTQERKRREAEILGRHRKEEKELVKQGKKPFYLKKSERQKRVMIETYGQLKGKQLDHVLERRRRKLEHRDKKKLPWARREAPKRSN